MDRRNRIKEREDNLSEEHRKEEEEEMVNPDEATDSRNMCTTKIFHHITEWESFCKEQLDKFRTKVDDLFKNSILPDLESETKNIDSREERPSRTRVNEEYNAMTSENKNRIKSQLIDELIRKQLNTYEKEILQQQNNRLRREDDSVE